MTGPFYAPAGNEGEEGPFWALWFVAAVAFVGLVWASSLPPPPLHHYRILRRRSSSF